MITVGPDAPWKQIAEQMLNAEVSGLPVTNDDGLLLGIVTEADLISRTAFGQRRHRPLAALIDLMTGDAHWATKASGLTAADLMTTDVVTASPGDDVAVAAQRMLDRRVNCLPVLDGGQLEGIVARCDLLRVVHHSADDIAAEVAENAAGAP